MPIRKLFVLSTLLGFTSLVAAEGLVLRDAASSWPTWQARLSLTTAATGVPGASRISLVDAEQPVGGRHAIQSAALLGDYYLHGWTPAWLSKHGAVRATSGLLVGSRSLAVSDAVSPTGAPSRLSLAVQALQPAFGSAGVDAGATTVPYLGIGYSGLSFKGGWGITADLGVTAEKPGGAWRVGRAMLGNQGAESSLRELRLSPLLQVGVRYSF
jgi:hypothetical protein